MPAPFEPISLGYACEVKYQLSRELYFRKFPQGGGDGDDGDFRRMLFTPDLGSRTFNRHIFDWQITPFEALIVYLETDFKGVYEREDFEVDAATGEVVHKRLGTRHPHDFKPVDGRLDDAAIDAGYPAALGKFEHLAQRFRRHLATPGPYLYVFKQIRILTDAVRLAQLLRAANPDHQFKILFVDYEGQDQMLDELDGEVFRAWVPWDADKPEGRGWEGDDGRWRQILAPFHLTIHGGDQMTRTFDESQAAAEPELPPPSPAAAALKEWLARLGRALGR